MQNLVDRTVLSARKVYIVIYITYKIKNQTKQKRHARMKRNERIQDWGEIQDWGGGGGGGFRGD